MVYTPLLAYGAKVLPCLNVLQMNCAIVRS